MNKESKPPEESLLMVTAAGRKIWFPKEAQDALNIKEHDKIAWIKRVIHESNNKERTEIVLRNSRNVLEPTIIIKSELTPLGRDKS